MSARGRKRGAYTVTKDDQAAGFSGDQSDFLYDVEVKTAKLAAYRLFNSIKQLYKLQPDIIRKQEKLATDKNYTSKLLKKQQDTYHTELKEAEDLVIEISNLLHRVPKEVKPLDRRHVQSLREKMPRREKEQATSDRSWQEEDWRNKLQKAKEDCDKNLALSNSLKDQVNGLIRENNDSKKENGKLEKELSEREHQIRELQSETARLLRNYNKEKAEKDDALTRLSAVASSKIRDNNPNIADLSDVNRPTKIAEKMSELYDNEWTDAFDILEKSNPDMDVVKTLLDILKNINTQCCEMACPDFFLHVQNAIVLPAKVLQKSKAHSGSEDKVVLTKEMQQQIKELRKLRAPSVLPILQCELVPKDVASNLRAYYNTCVEVCWLAAVQDPPLFMNFNTGEKFDTTLFKDYTARGPYVEFLVWPALHLHDQGPLLSKGVAQGTSKRPVPQLQFSQPQIKDATRSFRVPKKARKVERSNSNTTC